MEEIKTCRENLKAFAAGDYYDGFHLQCREKKWKVFKDSAIQIQNTYLKIQAEKKNQTSHFTE